MDLSLCRYTQAGEVRLGLVSAGQVYDLTATGQPEYAGMQAWLTAAAGRVPQALAALERVASDARPVYALQALLDPQASPRVLRPLDAQEVWACGVTYQMSRAARMRESEEPTIYGKVYDAPRPEIFFKDLEGYESSSKAIYHHIVLLIDLIIARCNQRGDVRKEYHSEMRIPFIFKFNFYLLIFIGKVNSSLWKLDALTV